MYLDNQAVVHALNGHETKSEIVHKTYQALNNAVSLTGLAMLSVRWIRGHEGQAGNTRADEAARAGRDDPARGVPDPPKQSFKFAKTLLASALVSVWNARWEADITCRQTKMWFPHARPGLSEQLMMEDRRRLSQYILIMTGHNFWRRQNFLVDSQKARRGQMPVAQVVPPYCNLCMTEMPLVQSASNDDFLQTTWHLYASCEALATLRQDVFGEAYYKPLEEIKKSQILEFARMANLSIFPPDNSEVAEFDSENLLTEDKSD